MKIVLTLLILLSCQSFTYLFHHKAQSFLENKFALELVATNKNENKNQRTQVAEFKQVKCSMITEDEIFESDNNLRLEESGIYVIKPNEEVKIKYSE
jgi:hypothetical protein